MDGTPVIKMLHINGLNCPCAVCDVCAERIEYGGMLVWKADAPDDLRMVHIGDCDRLNNLLDGKFEMSQELDQAMSDLLHNVTRPIIKKPTRKKI